MTTVAVIRGRDRLVAQIVVSSAEDTRSSADVAGEWRKRCNGAANATTAAVYVYCSCGSR